MHFSLSPEMMREIIMDHYTNPRNKKEVNDERYQTVYMDSTSCIDKVYVQILIENNIVKDAVWHGVGCAISTASTSIMTELLKDKTVDEANNILKNYFAMIDEKEFDETVLDEAVVFMNTSRQPARIKCATIGFRGADKILKGDVENG